jgi:hypothetical protein
MTTYHTVRIAGVPLGVPNVTDDTPVGYYVSYNNYDRRIFGCDTTAIVIDKTSAFLILNGDHRDALKGLSLDDACAYFHANVDKKNYRSDDHEDDVLVKLDGKWQMVRRSPDLDSILSHGTIS